MEVVLGDWPPAVSIGFRIAIRWLLDMPCRRFGHEVNPMLSGCHAWRQMTQHVIKYILCERALSRGGHFLPPPPPIIFKSSPPTMGVYPWRYNQDLLCFKNWWKVELIYQNVWSIMRFQEMHLKPDMRFTFHYSILCHFLFY